MSINEFLQERRIEQKLSIQKLSKASGISASHISRIERLKRNPTPKTLRMLSFPLGVSYIELLEVANLIQKNNTNDNDLRAILLNEQCMFNGQPISEEVKGKVLTMLVRISPPQIVSTD